MTKALASAAQSPPLNAFHLKEKISNFSVSLVSHNNKIYVSTHYIVYSRTHVPKYVELTSFSPLEKNLCFLGFPGGLLVRPANSHTWPTKVLCTSLIIEQIHTNSSIIDANNCKILHFVHFILPNTFLHNIIWHDKLWNI